MHTSKNQIRVEKNIYIPSNSNYMPQTSKYAFSYTQNDAKSHTELQMEYNATQPL